MITISHLCKKYGNHYAVKDLNLTLEKGKIYGFLGPNGAGKTTTMNILTGYLAATEGQVTINGFDIQKQPEEAKRCIGYLAELPQVYPDMSVGEYLEFVAELKKVPAAERKSQLEELMALVQITDVRHRLIRNLSKGYRQRVGLAQALIGYPEIIILDEPTVGLDPKQILEIRDLIKKLGEKHTVILSSHILSEVSAVCDQILILNKGKLVAGGTPDELQKRMQGNGQMQVVLKGSREELEQILARAELPFTLIQPVSQSLEDIFLTLTKEDQSQEAGTEEPEEVCEKQQDECREMSGKADGVKTQENMGEQEAANHEGDL